MKTGDLHLHTLDRYDSQNLPEEVCKRLKELGAIGFASTQHGVLAGVEPMRDAAAKYGLKYIPGIEAYHSFDDGKRRHDVLLAKSYKGWIAISKAVSQSQDEDGYSVMTDEILKKHFGPGSLGHGEVIFLSACIQGIFGMILRTNEYVNREVAKLQEKLLKTVPEGTTESFRKKQAEVDQAAVAAESANRCYLKAKEYAEMKFSKREKALQKLTGDALAAELSAIARDKNYSEKAKAVLPELRDRKADSAKRLTVLKKELGTLQAIVDRGSSFRTEIETLEAGRKNPSELQREVRKEMAKYADLFGRDNFYIEVQYHGMPEEVTVYPVLARIAREEGYPIVATNDCHIVRNTEDEFLRRNTLRALRFGEWEDVQDSDKELYIKTDEEMVEWLSKILPADVVEEAMSNIGVILNRCNVEFPKESHYPKFPTPEGVTSEEVFDQAIENGIQWRFPEGMDEAHQKRLAHEKAIIKSMGYVDYHMIVKDFLEYGRALSCVPWDLVDDAPLTTDELKAWTENKPWVDGFTIGPGRGSAVGSIVCYLLGITSLDPLKYDLLFERFLNPERVSMPDIDSDIAASIRPKVIEYIRHKYGENAVCGILTTNAQAPKGCIRMAAKYYAVSRKEEANKYLPLADQMAKAVPSEPNTFFDTEVDDGVTVYDRLIGEFRGEEEKAILAWAKSLEGSFTSYGAHAAGIVISDNDDISDYVPLRWNKKLGEFTTQCDMYKVEENGLLKMDCLGLKTLDVITETIRMIYANHGILIDPLQMDITDRNVYRGIFQKGRTNSVFQFESDGMKSMLKRFKPESFEDLIILVSMFRPGPLQFLDDVIAVKNGAKAMEFITPEVEPILGKTYGAITYQEQVMQIFQDLAGYSLGGADQVRRYMSKKKMDKLVHEREAFINGDPERNIEGCVARGISVEAAEKLFDQMTEFAKYAFNKSHAAAYAYNSYVTAWLKYYYPAEFLAAALNWADTKKVPGLMRDAAEFDVKVEGPNINKAEADFSVHDGHIVFGMSAVKGVGNAGDEILSERSSNGPFRSLLDFHMRVNVSKTAVCNLIAAGGFDDFNRSREAMAQSVETYKKAVKKFTDAKNDDKVKTADEKVRSRLEKRLSDAEESMKSILLPEAHDDPIKRLQSEYEFLGEFISAHPLDYFDKANDVTEIEDLSKGWHEIRGAVTLIEMKRRKADGKAMAFVTVEDRTGEVTVNFFTKAYAQFGQMLEPGAVLRIAGRVDEEETDDEDENGLPVVRYSMSAQSCMPARRRLDRFVLKTSYPRFHLEQEKELRSKYEDMRGHEFIIDDTVTGTRRKMTYHVSQAIMRMPGIYRE